jgi:hypothetical protein
MGIFFNFWQFSGTPVAMNYNPGTLGGFRFECLNVGLEHFSRASRATQTAMLGECLGLRH